MELLGTMLPLALVVGLSPLPILPAVLLLMTDRPRANGGAYLAAWLVALAALVGVALLLGSASQVEEPDATGVGWLQLITGAAFLVMAVVKWVRRPRPEEPKATPGWMAALDSATPATAARLGALMAGGNPKNIVMALAAGAEIAVLAENARMTAAAVLVFLLVGSLGVGTPICARLLLGERVDPALARGRTWLVANGTALSIGVLVVLGAALLLGGLPRAA